VTEARLIEEIRLCALVARTLAMYLKGDPDLLPQLRTVSMGDIPNITWNSPMAQKTEIGMLSSSPQLGLQYKSLARFLVNLPKVAHACQATQFGPLGLSHGANRIQNPPAVFTYHPKLPSPFCPCTDALGPIILGTMNRHYYTCLYAMEDESVIMADVINNVVGSVCSTPISDTGEDLGDTADSDDLGDTMVELYDYVRVSAPTPNSWSDPIPTPRGHSAKSLPTTILSGSASGGTGRTPTAKVEGKGYIQEPRGRAALYGLWTEFGGNVGRSYRGRGSGVWEDTAL
jgi:hypothetical protein